MTAIKKDTNLLDVELIPSLGGPPHELFDQWRLDDPVHWNPPSDTYISPMPGASVNKGFWVLTRHKDVFEVSRNQKLFSSHDGGPIIWDFEPQQLAMQQANIMGMQPENHAAVKRLVVPAFGPKELEGFYPEVDRVAKEIIDDVAPKGHCEFVFDVASRLPVYTFCTLMGIPEALHEKVFQLGNAAADTENPNRSDETNSAPLQLMEMAAELAEQKRQTPDDSMFSRLIHGEVDGEKLDAMAINMFFVTLSIAGHETTRSTAVHFIRLMNEHPDQFELLKSDVDRYLPNAIEEVLRFSPPVIKFRRTATQDTEIGGYPIAKGDKIYLSYPAANRDPEVFEDPHRFDITRENANKHLSFGTGPHVCLGARLARYQLKALLGQILSRLPDVHIDGETEMLKSIWFNAVMKMPVSFRAES
ncbi:MAG: cytochrome P450 [Pseudomonadales bacterium]